MTEEFNLLKRNYDGENNPHWKGINTKEMSSHEKYLRYKDTIKRNNKRNYKKYKFGRYVKKYKECNPEKIKAKDKSKYIIIPKGTFCVNCNASLATQKHHEDYSKPLQVIFVCRSCHGELEAYQRVDFVSNECKDSIYLKKKIKALSQTKNGEEKT